ncbi:hypothetical protein SAMN05421509_10448 [Chromohalobacter canadensis]|uniref:Uncharacterized protein n=1 Tax=Chromohalobacter canadensis TaxID=141389 RepID=A0A285VKZ4_9GAMM|nr:hypothetical protein [Chromohalobacter canadensis]SOC54643.1 hypothetical protein SAMN05421509_10448 [Chromohalobacter canadensis]
MAKIQDPILFSSYFGIEAEVLDDKGLIDPFLNVDTRLFVDPVLLEKSDHEIIKNDSLLTFKNHFSNFVRLLAISEDEGDAAWKGAQKLLDLREPPENGLGFGGSDRAGSSRPEEIRDQIVRTAKEIIDLGSKDPEMISLMGFFEEGVGPDTISDFTTRIIMTHLAKITQYFCENVNIPVHDFDGMYKLPRYEIGQKTSFVVLVPRDIVRDLPIANDWSDVNRAVMENNIIRDRVSSLLAGIAKPTIAERKEALRYAALESATSFSEFLKAVKNCASSYDPSLDELGYYALKKIFSEDLDEYRLENSFQVEASPEKLRLFVIKTLEHFKHHVENGNLWEELWVDGKPKKERAAQLIYYAMADCFCKANDIDVSPEANMGGGPIDFKFSKGYEARVLVEMKRSSGKVASGYSKQLEIYKNASRTEFGVYVVIDYGDRRSSFDVIREERLKLIESGEPASDILVIDATPKDSASIRKEVGGTIPLNFGDS